MWEADSWTWGMCELYTIFRSLQPDTDPRARATDGRLGIEAIPAESENPNEIRD